MSMRERLKEKARRALEGAASSGFRPIQIVAKVADTANVLLGDPLEAVVPTKKASPAESPAAAPVKRAAPVFLYVEWDSPGKEKVEALLKKRDIPYKVLPVDHDEVTKELIARTKFGKAPVLFIATDAIGWLNELEDMPEGELERRVFGIKAR